MHRFLRCHKKHTVNDIGQRRLTDRTSSQFVKDLQFCWVPAHEGVKRNESAEKLAKEAL